MMMIAGVFVTYYNKLQCNLFLINPFQVFIELSNKLYDFSLAVPEKNRKNSKLIWD